MKLSTRHRLTLFFTALFGFLIIVTLGLLYSRISTIFHRDFQLEMVHDGRVIAELFKEEVKLSALAEFQEEVQEFEIEILVLDQKQGIVVESEGWKSSGVVISQSDLNRISEQPYYRAVEVGGNPLDFLAARFISQRLADFLCTYCAPKRRSTKF